MKINSIIFMGMLILRQKSFSFCTPHLKSRQSVLAGVNRVSYFKSVTCQYPLTHNRQGREEFDSFLTCHPSSQVWNLGRRGGHSIIVWTKFYQMSTTYPIQVENYGHLTQYLLFVLVIMPGLFTDHLPTFSCPCNY